jgi:uncharacterized protein YjdB
MSANIELRIFPKEEWSWVGKKEYLRAYIFPSNAIPTPTCQWKIADPSIVYQGDDGWFYSKKVGQTTITAVSDDGKYQASMTWTVEDASNIQIRGYRFYTGDGGNGEIERYVLGYGDVEYLCARSFSNQDDSFTDVQISHGNFTWSSSDSEIATVVPDQGDMMNSTYHRAKITAGNKSGIAKIRITSNSSGSYAEFPVHVQPEVIHAKKFKISPSSLNLVKGQRVQLSGIFTPENTTNKRIYWFTSLGAVTLTPDQDGWTKAMAVGKHYINARTEDGDLVDRINVTVVEGTNPISNITIDGKTCTRIWMDGPKSRQVYKTTTVYVPTLPGQDASDVGINVSVKDPSIVTVNKIETPSNKSNRRVIHWNTIKPGYTTATITSKSDPTKSAVAEIMVLSADRNPTSTSSNIYLPETIIATPDDIEVERGQVFTIWARGFGGEHQNYEHSLDLSNQTVFNDFWSGGWDFVPSVTQIEPLKVNRDSSQVCGWFRAGYIPGDYEIRVTPRWPDKMSKDFKDKIIKVKIVDKLFTDPYIELIPRKYYICFKDADKLSDSEHIMCYTDNPAEFYIGWIKTAGSSTEYPTRFNADDFTWKIAHDGIISKIETDGKYFRIYRGPNYGITQLTFYLKENPHIYYSLFAEYDGGDWRYYTTDKNIITSSNTGSSSSTTPAIKPTSVEVIPVSSETTNTNTSTTPGESIIVTDTVTYRTGGYNSKYNYNSDTGLADSYIEPKVKRKISSGTSNYKDPGYPKNGSSSS